MRRLFAVLLLAIVALYAFGAAGATAAKPKGCGTVVPSRPPNSGGGAAAFKVKVVRGHVGCATAKAIFKDIYTDSSYNVVTKLVVVNGFTCSGDALGSSVVKCKKGKDKVTGTVTGAPK